MPRTGSKGASAGTSHLIPKAQLQFQSQRRPPGMPGTLAKAPGWRPELSTRQCRGSAGRTCVSADRHPNFGPRSSGDLSRSPRLRSNHDLSSRCLHIEVDLASAARLVVAPVGFHHSALIVHVPRSSPVGEATVRASLIAPLRRHVEVPVCPEELFAAALAAKSSAETPRNACWEARSEAIRREISSPAVAPRQPRRRRSARRRGSRSSRTPDFTQRLSYSSWRRYQIPVSLRRPKKNGGDLR
jgi:hypothetical protein